MAASEYSNPTKAKDVLFNLLLAYVRSEDFGNLSDAERKTVVDQVDEIRNSISENNRGEEGATLNS